MFLKIVRNPGTPEETFTLTSGHRIYSSRYDDGTFWVTVEATGAPGGVSYQSDHDINFYIMNDSGDTIDRVYGCAAEARPIAGSETIVYGDGDRQVRVGKSVRQVDGSVGTSVDLGPGEGPALLCDRAAGQLAAALLARSHAPDAPRP